MAGDLFHWKGLNKVRLMSYSIWNDEIRYDWQFDPIKWPKQGEAGTFFHRNGENNYGWGFIPFKMIKLGTAEELFYSKGQNEVTAGDFFIEMLKLLVMEKI